MRNENGTTFGTEVDVHMYKTLGADGDIGLSYTQEHIGIELRVGVGAAG